MFQLKNLIPLGIKLTNAISYILYDQFITDLAAGSVNGTQAEPIGGVRTVVDTENKLSISVSKLIVSGKVVPLWNDPSIRYPVTSRVKGKTFLVNINLSTINGDVMMGFDNNTTAFLDYDAVYFTVGGNLVVWNLASVSVGSYSASTQYIVAIVLSNLGAYQLIKGGVFVNWTLLYKTNVSNFTPLYPTITNYSHVFTADNIRIPVPTWLPTPLAYSTFSADGATTTEAGTPDGVAAYNAPALAITSQAGTFAVASGKGSFTALSGGGIGIMTIPTTSTINVLHDIIGVRSAGDVGIVVRYVDSSNYVRVVHNGTNVQLVKVVAGTPTTLINTAATYSASAVLRVICYGTKFRVYYNNAFIGSEQTISDAALQAGVVGLYSSDTGNTFDGLTVFARGTSNEYSALDGF